MYNHYHLDCLQPHYRYVSVQPLSIWSSLMTVILIEQIYIHFVRVKPLLFWLRTNNSILIAYNHFQSDTTTPTIPFPYNHYDSDCVQPLPILLHCLHWNHRFPACYKAIMFIKLNVMDVIPAMLGRQPDSYNGVLRNAGNKFQVYWETQVDLNNIWATYIHLTKVTSLLYMTLKVITHKNKQNKTET